MSPSTRTFRLVTAERARPRRRESTPEPEVINLTMQSDQLLLTVPEAAHRLGIGRSFMYQLIAAGEIETIRIGRLRKIAPRAVEAFVERRNPSAETTVADQTDLDRSPATQ
ncbi:helix-turn-helix domain-containing protein [Pengzhenrongella sp.]|jgi:excisionase family DNA binding protein|uniref:helix-turn-helix domain-containing protein n=1 Tax=Pengzhenrongella sp. TaxID=2888820 RepID=UPI002F94512D